MEGTPLGVVRTSRSSSTSIVDKGWNLISQNTELIFFIALGFVEILAEAAGYRRFNRVNDLLPPLPDLADNNVNNATQTNNTELADVTNFTFIYKISQGVDSVGAYTVHITLAAHLLLPYPVITEHQKVLLVPWLIVTLLRSVLRELVISLVVIVVCASHDVFHYPCIQYSALQGAQFCFTLYFWTSVHSFYHYLNKKQSAENRVNSVINSIKRSSILYESPSVQLSVDQAFTNVDEDDDNTETTLVERAAMAWIAREILENDGEYVTDKQFSQYLVVKATIELRQALKELAEKKRRKAKWKLSHKQRIEESLEFMKLSTKESKHTDRSPSLTGVEAFDMNKSLSRRDPIRKIRPLTTSGKPVSSDVSLITGISILSDTTVESTASADSGSQTEPPTHQISRMLDILEFQQQQRHKKIEEGQHGTI